MSQFNTNQCQALTNRGLRCLAKQSYPFSTVAGNIVIPCGRYCANQCSKWFPQIITGMSRLDVPITRKGWVTIDEEEKMPLYYWIVKIESDYYQSTDNNAFEKLCSRMKYVSEGEELNATLFLYYQTRPSVIEKISILANTYETPYGTFYQYSHKGKPKIYKSPTVPDLCYYIIWTSFTIRKEP